MATSRSMQTAIKLEDAVPDEPKSTLHSSVTSASTNANANVVAVKIKSEFFGATTNELDHRHHHDHVATLKTEPAATLPSGLASKRPSNPHHGDQSKRQCKVESDAPDPCLSRPTVVDDRRDSVPAAVQPAGREDTLAVQLEAIDASVAAAGANVAAAGANVAAAGANVAAAGANVAAAVAAAAAIANVAIVVANANARSSGNNDSTNINNEPTSTNTEASKPAGRKRKRGKKRFKPRGMFKLEEEDLDAGLIAAWDGRDRSLLPYVNCTRSPCMKWTQINGNWVSDGPIEIYRDSDGDTICVAGHLIGMCDRGCPKYHRKLTPNEVRKIADVGGLTLPPARDSVARLTTSGTGRNTMSVTSAAAFVPSGHPWKNKARRKRKKLQKADVASRSEK